MIHSWRSPVPLQDHQPELCHGWKWPQSLTTWQISGTHRSRSQLSCHPVTDCGRDRQKNTPQLLRLLQNQIKGKMYSSLMVILLVSVSTYKSGQGVSVYSHFISYGFPIAFIIYFIKFCEFNFAIILPHACNTITTTKQASLKINSAVHYRWSYVCHNHNKSKTPFWIFVLQSWIIYAIGLST